MRYADVRNQPAWSGARRNRRLCSRSSLRPSQSRSRRFGSSRASRARPHQLQSAAVRQTNIADDEIEFSFGRERARLGDAPAGADAITGASQNPLKNAGRVFVIADDKNGRIRVAGAPAPSRVGCDVSPKLISLPSVEVDPCGTPGPAREARALPGLRNPFAPSPFASLPR